MLWKWQRSLSIPQLILENTDKCINLSHVYLLVSKSWVSLYFIIHLTEHNKCITLSHAYLVVSKSWQPPSLSWFVPYHIIHEPIMSSIALVFTKFGDFFDCWSQRSKYVRPYLCCNNLQSIQKIMYTYFSPLGSSTMNVAVWEMDMILLHSIYSRT